MLKKGQIEEKEATELQGEIDKKIYFLTMHPPDIELHDHGSRIQFYSELSEVFDRNDLSRAMQNFRYKEKIYKPGDCIVRSG